MTREEMLTVAKPIIFCGDMVRAILDGRKTMTRRVIVPQPPEGRLECLDINPEVCYDGNLDKTATLKGLWATFEAYGDYAIDYPMRKSRYMVGDALYVRETWCDVNGKYYYKADQQCTYCTEDGICMPHGVLKHITCEACEYVGDIPKYRPSIHMPKAAARVFLRVTDVRVEPVQDITPVDVVREGAYPDCQDCIDNYGNGNQCDFGGEDECSQCDSVIEAFAALWDSINAKRGYGWDENPWVWVISFERIV
jgi:hypothetical protein